MPKIKMVQKLDAHDKPIHGRFSGVVQSKSYTPRILRGSIVLPAEAKRMAKAAEKRARKAKRDA